MTHSYKYSLGIYANANWASLGRKGNPFMLIMDYLCS